MSKDIDRFPHPEGRGVSKVPEVFYRDSHPAPQIDHQKKKEQLRPAVKLIHPFLMVIGTGLITAAMTIGLNAYESGRLPFDFFKPRTPTPVAGPKTFSDLYLSQVKLKD